MDTASLRICEPVGDARRSERRRNKSKGGILGEECAGDGPCPSPFRLARDRVDWDSHCEPARPSPHRLHPTDIRQGLDGPGKPRHRWAAGILGQGSRLAQAFPISMPHCITSIQRARRDHPKGCGTPRWLLSAIMWEQASSIVASVRTRTASLTIATRAEHAIAFNHDMDVNQLYERLCGSLAAKGPTNATPTKDVN
ncbi:hypothetical protein CFIO01_09355 [Colletotrichum fioriniae PJ7]|uniref:Uncharacterized protein n=1 Tax=Colletotrichum fioriniae PJ7 TaxID=1445577 RepID=A0A010QY57_9PEZI|nr:hypothetical protein CFIO01_09355 [Colletotrichum fioriniae PJ7]